MEQGAGRERRATYCFVHASDLHLDAPVHELAEVPPQIRTALRDAPLHAWSGVVDVAIARRAAFVLLAGGLLDRRAPTLRACLALRDGIRRLRAAAIDVIVALGEDDPDPVALGPWLAGARLLAAGQTTLIERDGLPLACVWVPTARRAGSELEAAPDAPAGCLRIALLPSGGPGADRVATADPELAYLAVGASAEPAVSDGIPWVVRAGTPQGRSLNGAQCGARGCMCAGVEAGRVPRVEHVATDAVRFVSLPIDLTEEPGAGAGLVERCTAVLAAATADAGQRLVIAEAVLRGSRAPSNGARIDTGALLEALRATGSASRVWWARVRDHATLTVSPLAPDICAALIEQSKALGAPLPRSSFLARTFAPLLQRWEPDLDLAEQRELVRDAAALALERMDAASLDAGG